MICENMALPSVGVQLATDVREVRGGGNPGADQHHSLAVPRPLRRLRRHLPRSVPFRRGARAVAPSPAPKSAGEVDRRGTRRDGGGVETCPWAAFWRVTSRPRGPILPSMTDTLDADPQTLDEIPREPTQDGPNVRLYLVDGSGFIFRAFHALPPLTRKSDGLPVGAVAGFCNMLWKLLVDMKASSEAPTHLAVIFDHSEETFRNRLYDQYKAHRPPPPEDLIPQFPLVRDATRAFGVPCLELPGYEADDLIAAYACKVRDAGGEVVIVSSDKDLMQLVGPKVSMLDTMKTPNLVIRAEQVFDKFGVTPDKVVDVQALCGDSVDNVPGAPGIGVKTASALINEYGDLETLLARAGEI